MPGIFPSFERMTPNLINLHHGPTPVNSAQDLAAVVTLGCSKNLVDSETLAPQLIQCGYELTCDLSRASLILINTCGFLESAVEEGIEAILELAAMKSRGCCRDLIVAGCLVQRYGKKLVTLLPEIDLFLGTSHFLELADILQERARGNTRKLWIGIPQTLLTSETPRLRSSGQYSAYLKIAEGCSNRCTFCKIPQLRGAYRSRTVADVVLEAERLATEGVKEINLIAQDSTAFGADRGDPRALLKLLEALDGLPGIAWIRLLYVYPERMSRELLQVIAQSTKIVHYLDMPLQHCVPHILQAMRRGGGTVEVHALLDEMRSIIPDLSLRTSLMVGFPGETETDFRQLLRFVEAVEFDHLGVFCFSPEQGTYAARLPFQVASEIKEERRHILLAHQKSISRRILNRLVGQTWPVLIEGVHPETELLLSGRLARQAPEVDGAVIITRGTGQQGTIAQARITRAHDYDVEAELLSGEERIDGLRGS